MIHKYFYLLILLSLCSCMKSNSCYDCNYEIRVYDHYSYESYKLIINDSILGCESLPISNGISYPTNSNKSIVVELKNKLDLLDYNNEPVNPEEAGLDLESEKVFLHIIKKQYNKNNIHYEYSFFKDFSGYSSEFEKLFILIEKAKEACEMQHENEN